MRRCAIIFTLLSIGASANAQERRLVREGNDLYSKQKYKEAAAAYEKALKEQPAFVPGAFNLGNALIQQKQYDAARKVMDNTVKSSKDPRVQGGAQYNKGNTFMSEQKWQEAVESYKSALRRNPEDIDAKYNLSYALSKLKQDQQQQNKDKKDDKDKKDQQNKQDKKDKGDQKKDDKQQDQNQSQEGGDQKQAQRPEPQSSKLSQQQADNLLKALQQDERKTQDKMQQAKGTPVKLQKDW